MGLKTAMRDGIRQRIGISPLFALQRTSVQYAHPAECSHVSIPCVCDRHGPDDMSCVGPPRGLIGPCGGGILFRAVSLAGAREGRRSVCVRVCVCVCVSVCVAWCILRIIISSTKLRL